MRSTIDRDELMTWLAESWQMYASLYDKDDRNKRFYVRMDGQRFRIEFYKENERVEVEAVNMTKAIAFFNDL